MSKEVQKERLFPIKIQYVHNKLLIRFVDFPLENLNLS